MSKNTSRARSISFYASILLSISALLLLERSVTAAAAAPPPVKAWEEQLVIPTYLIGPPDPNPQFYFGGQSQGAEHRIYPYPAYDNLTTEKVNKTYKMVYLENEYVKVGILPEIGGRIFEAIDKTNGYNFFYRQHVIKPALISILGAWISGGVEWDVPHHHRATSFLPVQYKIEEDADGSKTVWVGELELRDRMRWAVGTTLHPGKSYLDVSFRMINRTPLPTSMLCFSNVAVHVDDTYQVIFPPSTQHGTYHSKRDFTTWPIATTRYNGADFTAGVDISWYKNHYNSNSVFAWNYQDDFLAGYNHGKQAGTMAIADHNVVPGKKFWTWGNGPNGRAQDTLLTDSDGPYIELMVGAYSDNQPDYTWLQPYETRSWTQYWYPFRDIDGVKNANTEAAVNLDVKDGKARFGFCTTSAHAAAVVSLKLNGQALAQETVAISPGKPYVKEVAIPAGTDEHDLRAAVLVDGKELVAYSPVRLQPEAMPKNVTPYQTPVQIKTNEELLLTGQRIAAFHDPQLEPEPYWEEALKRDPFDIRVNTALAINYIKKARYEDAEKLLRKALERATDKYTMPKDGEAFYYLGLALRGQGKIDEAFTNFYKSTWSAAWRGPGYFELAQIASLKGDAKEAMALVDHSLEANALNIRALTLKMALLRHAGMMNDVLALISACEKIDPLDVRVMSERDRVRVAPAKPGQVIPQREADANTTFMAMLKEHPATGLETVSEYLNAGLWEEAFQTASNVMKAQEKPLPLACYYMGYAVDASRINQQKAGPLYQTAATLPVDYAFPFQREMIDVLNDAMRTNPTDSHAPYYLGNLLYDWQPDRAVALWEKSAALGAAFPEVYRNLAVIYKRQGNARDKMLAALEKGVEFGGNALIFTDLDQLYQENAVTPEKRLALLEQHQSVINRDAIIAREIDLKIFAGKCDDAIELLKSRFFRAWEGGGRFNVGDSWTNALLLRGHQHMAAKQYKEALADYQAALTFPTNLQEAVGGAAARRPEVAYWIGVAYEAMGDKEHAQQSWRESAGTSVNAPAVNRGATTAPAGGGRGGRGAGGGGRRGGAGGGARTGEAVSYYRALSLAKLGETDRAKVIFQQLVDSAAQSLTGAGDVNALPKSAAGLAQRTRIADAHYIAGLGQLGLGNKEKAVQEFALALSASPDHLGAKIAMELK